ncbi:MAG: FAD-binding protein, partial [Alphaproteobacteria bacterium]
MRTPYYAHTREPGPARAPVEGTIAAEVCVIGGGLAGIGCALALVERARSVVLIEAKRIGRAILPTATYVIVTEPLGPRLDEAIRVPFATSDTRFAQDYYRRLGD